VGYTHGRDETACPGQSCHVKRTAKKGTSAETRQFAYHDDLQVSLRASEIWEILGCTGKKGTHWKEGTENPPAGGKLTARIPQLCPGQGGVGEPGTSHEPTNLPFSKLPGSTIELAQRQAQQG
jgi:hypothetical protein